MIKIDGKEIADKIFNNLKKKEKVGANEMLAFVLVGNDAASRSFIERKMSVTRDILMIPTMLIALPAEIGETGVQGILRGLAIDRNIKGIVVQLPLPKGIDRDRIIAEIPAEKDVDNLRGGGIVKSPAVMVVEEVAAIVGVDIANAKVAVIGAGYLTGKPVFDCFNGKAKEIKLIDKGDDRKLISEADIIVSGVGKSGVVRTSEIKEGALVVDFGISFNDEGRLAGDLLIDKEIAGQYTPTPGGTGPILVAKLFENYYKLIDQNKKPD